MYEEAEALYAQILDTARGVAEQAAARESLNRMRGAEIDPTLVSAGGGILLGVPADGTVRWYNHLGVLDGTRSWAVGAGTTLNGSGSTLSKLSVVSASPLIETVTSCCGWAGVTIAPAVSVSVSAPLGGGNLKRNRLYLP